MFLKNKLKIIVMVFFSFVLVGCGAIDNIDNIDEQTSEQNNIDDQSEDYTPEKTLPEGLPVYPEAILTSDLQFMGNSWQWLYQTTGSGNEIVEFFVDSLEELGFDIDNDNTFATYEEFFITTTDNTVKVYWLDSESIANVDQVTPDTPNRHYSIIVDLTKWENR